MTCLVQNNAVCFTGYKRYNKAGNPVHNPHIHLLIALETSEPILKDLTILYHHGLMQYIQYMSVIYIITQQQLQQHYKSRYYGEV